MLNECGNLIPVGLRFFPPGKVLQSSLRSFISQFMYLIVPVAKAAASEIRAIVQDLEIAHPNAFIPIDVDFNPMCAEENQYTIITVSVSSVLLIQMQTHDLCYSNVKVASWCASPILPIMIDYRRSIDLLSVSSVVGGRPSTTGYVIP